MAKAEETVQVPVRLDRALYEDIRNEAKNKRISMAQLIRERLRIRVESTPPDVEAVKAAVLELLKTDAEVFEAFKAKA